MKKQDPALVAGHAFAPQQVLKGCLAVCILPGVEISLCSVIEGFGCEVPSGLSSAAFLYEAAAASNLYPAEVIPIRK
jgi:hypothetical protein